MIDSRDDDAGPNVATIFVRVGIDGSGLGNVSGLKATHYDKPPPTRTRQPMLNSLIPHTLV